MIKNPSIRLIVCGMACLFWELLFIRWTSASIRIVGYFTNFVLIASFFGLGLGALLTRFPISLKRYLLPAITLCVFSALILGGFDHLNPNDFNENIWLGSPDGIHLLGSPDKIPVLPLLALVYLLVSFVFIIFGQWLGQLFQKTAPLKAYSLEIFGSILGIWAFALLSYWQTSPTIWMLMGIALLLPLLEEKREFFFLSVFVALLLIFIQPIAGKYYWSPYYKIKVDPILEITEKGGNNKIQFGKTIGYSLTVNNDYHQMILNLSQAAPSHAFFQNWRALYDAPHSLSKILPEGPILIVGAGTGNDVSAALRSGNREIYAVDIDPTILKIGRDFHLENPYANPRVHIINDDARSFFQKTKVKFAEVIFGFLDSHTLLSSFSSLRLDNFVYTKESLAQVKNLLLPGGQVSLTFASIEPWIHVRFLSLLNGSFDGETQIWYPRGITYTNGVVYRNFKSPIPIGAESKKAEMEDLNTPTDDWPFLYLKGPKIPDHYIDFLAIILALCIAPLWLLPKGNRTLRLPYFFLGAAFFLLETSNIVSLSLLFGSTWIVNVFVFSGILCLVLAGNIFSSFFKFDITLTFLALFASVLLAYACPVSLLLEIPSVPLRAVSSTIVFLGPIFFAAIIFARLIENETDLYQAYGSNLLGAVMGGAAEYFSLMFGFKFLLGITLLCYLFAFIFLRRNPPVRRT